MCLDHDIFFSDDVLIRDYAHEMGHVLGMKHEQQHPDRDDFLNVDCTKLLGYTAAKVRRNLKPDPFPSMEEICESSWMGPKLLNWVVPTQFTRQMGSEGGVSNVPVAGQFDRKSIML